MNGTEFFPAVQNFEQGRGGEHRNKFEEVRSTVKDFSLSPKLSLVPSENRIVRSQKMAYHVINV